jgi:hypothetical protein
MRCQRFLLTYSQVNPDDFRPDAFPSWIEETFPKLKYCVAAVEEHHETEGQHVHAYVDAGSLFIINKADELDFAGYHPNIEAVRTTPHKAAEYAEKDGDVFFRKGTPPSSGSGPDNALGW